MNAPESSGEPSCKRQENGDASTGSDRPLKKARFAWQVKGKYHLKNENTEVKPSNMSYDDPNTAGPSSSSSSSDLIGCAEQNLEILGDYLLKQDFNTLDSVITDSDKSLLHSCPGLSSDQPSYPTYISSSERMNRPVEYSESVGAPMPLLQCASPSYNEDQCIARWQARQMAKGFVDNTINRVLDSWTTTHLPTGREDHGHGFLALDVAEFINNLPGDNTIENEGILMAISAHGLQNSNSSESDKEDSDFPRDSQSKPSRSNSPTITDKNQGKDKLDSDVNSSHDFHMSWLCENERDTNSSYYRDSTYLDYKDNQEQNSAIEFDDGNASADDYASHFDFMDAAVSFAIQNKGLTSLGTDYG